MQITELNSALEQAVGTVQAKCADLQSEQNLKAHIELCQRTTEAGLAALSELQETVNQLCTFKNNTAFGLLKSPATAKIVESIEALSVDHEAAIFYQNGVLAWLKADASTSKAEVEAKLAGGEGRAEALRVRIEKVCAAIDRLAKETQAAAE